MPLFSAQYVSREKCEMKSFAKLLLISTLLVGVCGCPAQSSGLRPGSAHFVIPAGTVLRVTLIDALSTDVSLPGDYFSASLAEAVVVDGRMLFAARTRVDFILAMQVEI
jgi:hypothetical protein